ncbi:hypothetical protein HPB51_013252 [Rhipicephalus microplus]|uniref:Uncharacterized protein n=1 Tax=Rhipicephalus microplus TaxID=6941 RepID=A0A9J6EA08_RHIMP|nr:hypothetical protein HPB51_013252 [Rhipicephalus microplus]
MRTDERKMRVEFEEIKFNLSHFSNSLDDVNRRLDFALNENKQIKKEYDALILRNITLEKVLATCETNMLKSEQYSRNRNTEINGIVKAADENIAQLLINVGLAIGETISACDVDVCHRVPSKGKEKPNIIVQFQRREKRDRVLARKKKITNATIGLPSDATIYVNEDLCPEMKRLLGMEISRTFCATDTMDVDEWLTLYERVSKQYRWDETLMLANIIFYL